MRKTASPKNKQVIKGLKLVHLNYANSDCQSTNFEYSHLLAFGPRPWRPRRSLLKICLDSDACFIDALPAYGSRLLKVHQYRSRLIASKTFPLIIGHRGGS